MLIEKPAGRACVNCPARDALLVHPEPARRADGKTRLVVVGESPPADDVHAGRPFASRGGQMLQRGLSTIGFRYEDVHWTNAVLCQCGKDDMAAAAKACRRRLHEELHATQAPAILTVGSWSLRSVLRPKSSQIKDWRGSINALAWKRDASGKLQAFNVSEEAKVGAESRERDAQPRLLGSGQPFSYVLPVMHPVFVMRSPEWTQHLEIDIARLGRVLHGSWQAPEHAPGRQLLLCETDLSPLDALRGPELATDVETVGLGCMSTRLICFVVSDDTTSVIVPWSRDLQGQTAWWSDPSVIARKLSGFWASRVAITHNGFAFDYPIFERYGIRIPKREDTLVAAHAFASHLPKKLSHVATTYLDVPAWKSFTHADSMQRMWSYCGADGLYTKLVRNAQLEELE